MKSKAKKKVDEKVSDAKNSKTQFMASGGSVGSASKRADGIAQRGKTKGKFV